MLCPACGAERFRSREVLHDLSVSECLSCGLLLSEIRTERRGSEYGNIDPGAYERSIGAVRAQQAVEIVGRTRAIIPGGRWLDAGCGFGYVLQEAQQAGFSVSGVEPDPIAARAASERLGVPVGQGIFDDGTAPDGSLDVISTLDVLEHVPPDQLAAFAARVGRKLRPGGVWVIKVPSSEGLFFRIAHTLGRPAGPFLRRLWQCDEAYPHTVYFHEASLGRFLDEHGFAVLQAAHLADVPNATVVDRLTVTRSTPRWLARLVAPAFYAVNAVESLRGRSDALLVIARSVRTDPEAPRRSSRQPTDHAFLRSSINTCATQAVSAFA
ncbi:MAG TPA: class I SAM-dependent methyltransferase [Thermoanaerobaculia bacterium]|nr:class I SAM-dependent methyltransferase [Thermoanaerobaculia bacterium]